MSKFAWRLAGKYGFTRHDRDEIEQQLHFKLAKNHSFAEPNSPQWKAHMAQSLRCESNNLIRDHKAPKRDYRRTCSLRAHVDLDDDEGRVEIAETIVADQVPSRRHTERRHEEDRTDLAIDMDAYIARLPDQRRREFCRRLMHYSISQIAKDMNIPSSTLHGWKRQLRQELGKLGFLDYF